MSEKFLVIENVSDGTYFQGYFAASCWTFVLQDALHFDVQVKDYIEPEGEPQHPYLAYGNKIADKIMNKLKQELPNKSLIYHIY